MSAQISKLLLLSILALVGCDKGGSGVIGPGVSLPSIQYRTLDGKSVNLRDYKGNVLLINFLASWCAPCKEEMPELEQLSKIVSDKKILILAIGVDDDLQSLKDFRDETGVTFPFLVDLEGRSNRFFELSGFPETVIANSAGKIMLLPDNQSGEPVIKFIGPRQWSSEYFVSLLTKLP